MQETPDTSGRPFGDYQLHGELGRGGMGVVLKAWHKPSERWVALKLAPPTHHLSEARLERFRREGEIAAALRHPNLLRVHAAGVEGGQPFLAFELVEGCRTFSEFCLGASTRTIVSAVRDVALALGHAHAQGILHRDVKPGNVLIDAQGRARLADFGVALLAREEERLTQTGAMIGTPLYMAPEAIMGGRDGSGPPADVYALGVMLYEALGGEHPFADQGPAALIVPTIRAVRPLRELNASVPRALAAICERALAFDPAARYADGDGLAEALTGWLQGRVQPRNRILPALAGAGLLAGAALALAWRLPTPATATIPPTSPPAPSPSPTRAPAEPVETGPSPYEAALRAAQTEPLDVHALMLELRLLAERDDPHDAIAGGVADAVLRRTSAGGVDPAQAVELWSALAAAGCRPSARGPAEALIDEVYWSERFYDEFGPELYRQAVLAFVELDVDLTSTIVESLLPEDAPPEATLDIAPGRPPAEAYLAARLAAQKHLTEARLQLAALGADARLGPITRARCLVEAYRGKPIDSAQRAAVAQALELDPESPWTQALHAGISIADGEVEAARQAARRSVRLWTEGQDARRSLNDFYRRRFLMVLLPLLIETRDWEAATQAMARSSSASEGSKHAVWAATWRARIDQARQQAQAD